MSSFPKLLTIIGLIGIVIGAISFVLPHNNALQASFYGGLLLSMVGWSFSSNKDRDNIKKFLTTHRFGKFVGYFLMVVAIIIAGIALINLDNHYPSW